MTRKLLLLLTATASIGVAAPALAQPGVWQTIQQREAALNERIQAGVRNGVITTGEAMQLRDRLRALEQLEDSYRASGGGLDIGERNDLNQRFDALSASIRTQATDDQRVGNWVSLPMRRANLDARIELGIRNGALTVGEAANLRARFDALVRLETSYRNSGGGLDPRERDDLDRQYNQLADSIRTQATDNQTVGNWISIPQRKANLDSRIDAGVRNGALTPGEAASLRARFDAIVRLEANYRASGGLDARERAELDRQFDQLSAQIRAERTDNQRAPQWNLPGWNGGSWYIRGRWQPVQERRDAFNRIVDPRVQSGRLSRREADMLRSEFTRILNLQQRYMSGGLTNNERAEIDRQFNILVSRVRAQAADNNNGVGLGGRR